MILCSCSIFCFSACFFRLLQNNPVSIHAVFFFESPMTQEEQDSLGRLQKLRDSGVDPYPTKAHRTMKVREFLEQFERIQTQATPLTLVGRVRLLRPHGGLTFGQIQDESGLVQMAFRKDHVGEERYKEIQQTIDLGDFV